MTEVGDRYAVTGPAKLFAISTTLHASLLSRLDRLAPTREVAQIGAALGRSFSQPFERRGRGLCVRGSPWLEVRP